jgi:hypothetical protein
MNFDERKEIEFSCNNAPQPNSDKCIFHNPQFLQDTKNKETIEKEFEKK